MSRYEFDYSKAGVSGDVYYRGHEGDIDSAYPTIGTMIVPMHPADKDRWVAGQEQWLDEDESSDHYTHVSQWLVLICIFAYDNDHRPITEAHVVAVADDMSGPWDTADTQWPIAELDDMLYRMMNGTFVSD